jgi:PAS domain-containing protein
LEITHSDSRRSLRDRLKRLPRGKSESTGAEEKFIRLDGREVVVNVVLKSVDSGGVFATLIVARDLSKERDMEQSLVRAKNLAIQILANNSIATAVLSLDTGRFIETNEIFCRLVARPHNQIVGQPLSAIQLVGPSGNQNDFLSRSSQIDSARFRCRGSEVGT